jgi:hypothetical protein
MLFNIFILRKYMKYPAIAKIIILKGVDNVTLPENVKFQALSEAGQLLFKQGNYEESGKALGKAGNTQALNEATSWLRSQGRYKQASYFIRHSGDKKLIEECAMDCMHQGFLSEAVTLYEMTGNTSMVAFIKENF